MPARKKSDDRIEVDYREVSALIPYAMNARVHNGAQIAQIAASIKEFGFTNPVLVDGDNGIIAGHGRVLAARKLGLDQVPCIELNSMTGAQKRAYIIADNKLALNAGWDDDLLSFELGELKALDFDLSPIGFDDSELDRLLQPDLPTEKDHGGPEGLNVFGGATATYRGSVPVKFWKDNGYLKGDVLDFGAGHDEHGFTKYDALHHPDVEPLLRRWDTIMCNYVLNVQPAEHLIVQICALVARLVTPGGHALFAVRSDIEHSYESPSGVQVAKTNDEWADLLRQIFWVEPVTAKGFYGFVCTPVGGDESAIRTEKPQAKRPARRQTRSAARAAKG